MGRERRARPAIDEATLAQASAGGRDALGRLYEVIHPSVLAYLSALAPQEAEDLAADVFVALARALPSFEGGADALWALTFTIARRRYQDLGRSRARRRTDPSDTAGSTLRGGDTEAEALSALGDDAARRLVATLPADQAEVVLLRILGDLSVAETAAVVGKRPGAVRSLQHRALRRLARTLADPSKSRSNP